MIDMDHDMISRWPEYLIWFSTPDAKHFGDFRLAELDALLNLFGIDTKQLPERLPPVIERYNSSLDNLL